MDKLLDFFKTNLFDLIGLALPGFLFYCLLLYYFSFFTFPFTKQNLISNPELTIFQIIQVILISYIFGHVLKFLADYLYKVCEWLLDDGIYNLFKPANHLVKNGKAGSSPSPLLIWLRRCPLFKLGRNLFCFGTSASYSSDYHEMIVAFIQKTNEIPELSAFKNFTENDYKKQIPHPVYKHVDLLTRNKSINSLKDTHHAKNNLYKSLAVLSLIGFLINGFNGSFFGSAFFLLLFFVFHSLYKMYYALCASEILNILHFYYPAISEEDVL
jgi:hypothetical protein